MKAGKTRKSRTGRRVFYIVATILLALCITANVLATTLLKGLMDMMFGGDRTQISGSADSQYLLSEDVTDKASALKAANQLNLEVNEEGIILLKNDDSLPLAQSAKVTVFGKNSCDLAYGSTGSVGGTAEEAPDIYDSLESAGFSCNPSMKEFYEDENKSGEGRPESPSMLSGSIVTGFATGESPVSSYSQDILDSYAEYNDAALVVITRVSGENYDLPLTMCESDGETPVEGAASAQDHYLELDQNEQEMLQMACENFENVILVINSSTPLELGFLDGNNGGDETMLDYDFAQSVKAAVWIGLPGEEGIYALGEVLSGSVNPSGRTPDTYARDFLSIPAVTNFSCNGILNSDAYTLSDGVQNEYFIDYEEGIYVGYRYFETRGAEDEDWYENNVIYPFGYGLSYTTFSQNIKKSDLTLTSDSAIENDNMSITVTVKNTGSVAGKDVIEVYAHAPYYAGEIEKSEVVLVGFMKTDELDPGQSQDYTVVFDAYDFSSYDYNDANNNGNTGYELDNGDYTFSIRSDAHTVLDSVTVTLDEDVLLQTDTVTGQEVTNRFDDIDDQLGTVLSRNDWEGTWPTFRTDEEKEITQYGDFLAQLSSTDSGNPLTADSEVVISENEKHPAATKKSAEGLQLYDLIGKDFDDEEWDEMLSRVTLSTIWDVLSDAAFKTKAIDYISKPSTIESDGPSGFTKFMGDTSTIYDTCLYCSECVLAATWNTDLAYRFGEAIGDEGLIGDENNGLPYSGLYGPGSNIHRTPFGGRNPEYYSEDGFLSGAMAAQVTSGASSKGVYMYMKHFVVNDQETHRGGVCTWLTEQALRELYLKPFEIAVKSGGTTAIMTSFNRIGAKWTGGDYSLITEVLRTEWGFNGTIICDFASGQTHMSLEQQVYAGGDLWLDTITPNKWYDKDDPLDQYLMQASMKRVLYNIANSNALNGFREGTEVVTKMAYWRIALIVADTALALVILLWGLHVFRNRDKKPKKPSKSA